MDFLLVGLILCRGVIEHLFGEDTLSCQLASTIERNFVVRRGSTGLSQVVLRLLDFLGTGAILKLLQPLFVTLHCASGLLVLRAKFLIFYAYHYLAFLQLVAFFGTNPGSASR